MPWDYLAGVGTRDKPGGQRRKGVRGLFAILTFRFARILPVAHRKLTNYHSFAFTNTIHHPVDKIAPEGARTAFPVQRPNIEPDRRLGQSDA